MLNAYWTGTQSSYGKFDVEHVLAERNLRGRTTIRRKYYILFYVRSKIEDIAC